MWRWIALAVLLLGIAGILRLYFGGFVWKNGLSLETTVVLFVGLLAFLAVMVQVEAERYARAEEAERQKRGIATAILFEIDSFRTVELDFVEEGLACRDAAGADLPTVFHFPRLGLRTNISEVYKGVAPILGSLDAHSVSAIVRFYAAIGIYEGLWHNYQCFLDMLQAPVNPAVRQDPQDLANEAKRQLKCIRDFIPQLRTLAGNAVNSVARNCGLEKLIERSNAQTH
jgi:hypothetical protein